MERFHVRVAHDDLVFSASHFITFDGVCERLHGHNYRVAVEVAGPLGEDHYVVDFVALRRTVRQLLAEFDHRVILPTEHPEIRVLAGPDEVQATFADRRWVFPVGDCLLLAIPNTTAELLARHIATRLLDAIESAGGRRPQSVRVELEECFGRSAVCELADA